MTAGECEFKLLYTRFVRTLGDTYSKKIEPCMISKVLEGDEQKFWDAAYMQLQCIYGGMPVF